jgi:hypothetical protein
MMNATIAISQVIITNWTGSIQNSRRGRSATPGCGTLQDEAA